MPVTLSKIDVAVQHLRSAILLYRQGSALHSVIHLAAAAEEIFGYELARRYPSRGPNDFANARELQFQNALDVLRLRLGRELSAAEVKVVRKEVLAPKNSVKHFTDPTETHADFDPVLEARNELFNAIFNYDLLVPEEDKDEEIFEFESFLHEEEINEVDELLHRIGGI